MNRINKLSSTLVTISIMALLISGCGESSIEIDDSTYEPKITINGLLNPQQSLLKISVGRNFPIGQIIDKSEIALSGAIVQLTDLSNDRTFIMPFNTDSGYFELTGSELKINYGQSYRLDISANVNGEQLTASSTTRVPDEGLAILPEESIVGDMIYRQKDLDGELVVPLIAFRQSENVAFYLLSFMAEDTSDTNFIYENPMGADIEKMRENGTTARDLQYGAIWERLEDNPGQVSDFESNWFWFWYYGSYRFILYAGDENYYHYLATHNRVMGMDGNLHEPIFDIEGDGIGIFGSVITDTIYVNVLKQ